MDLEITNWNNNIINELTSDIFITKSNLNESIIDDSNYVSEDSVTLTEGSVEKDEDSLDYQNEYGNIDSITNSISDEFRDLNEKCMIKGLHSNNMEVVESNFKPLDYKEELINEILLSENLAKEIVLHNIIMESDNGEITSLINTNEVESDKMNTGNDNFDDANFYDCEDSEFHENISNNYENVQNNLNKSYDIVSGKLSDIEMIKADSLELSSNSSKNSSMTNNYKINKCFSNTNSDKSELKSSEIIDASSDESCLDYNNQDFVSSNWLISVNDDFVENDYNFDIENVFSFKKMKLSHFKIKDPLSLSLEISRKSSQNNNSYLKVCSSFQNNDTPIDFTNIHSSSTPYSTKHKNHNKNETFSKSGTFQYKSPIMQAENVKFESIDNVSQNFTNKTFNLEETKEMKPIDTDLSAKPNLLAPCSQINSDIHDETVDLSLCVKLNKLEPSKLQKPVDNGIVRDKSNRLSKKLGSLLSIPSKSNSKSSDKPIDETKNKSLLKSPLSIKPPAHNSVVKKLFSKTLPRDTVAPISSLVDVKTRFMPPYDPNRRHTITEEVFNSTQAVPKPSSRPTSLIKPIDPKQQSIGGNCRIAKPIRPSSFMTSDKAQKSLSTQSSSQKESGIPKTVKSIKLQQIGIQKNKNLKLSEKIISNQQDDNINTKPIDDSSQFVPVVAIVTPIISENPPIISPSTANSIINNPLNRTFDRDDFQTLKSSNNNNNDNDNDNNCSSESSSLSSDLTIRSSTASQSSTADSENNNKSQQISRSSEQLGIYQLAQKEEENLKKHVNNSALITRQTAGFRSLKLPTQIKPRITVPSSLLKK